MQMVKLARNAMGTRFEFVLCGSDPVPLRAAGEEALEEVQRLDAQLSLYNPASEIAQVNARAAFEPVRVSGGVFHLLEEARRYWAATEGAFDITVAPLVRCWGFMKGSGSRPPDEAIAAARQAVGMQMLDLDPAEGTVRFHHPGMMLDLGSIGKGYALDAAAEIVREAGVERALLHGGTSTVIAIGTQPDGAPWKIAVEMPVPGSDPANPVALEVARVVELKNEALSVSAVSGKFFVLDGRWYGHVLDPRTGWSAENALMGCVVGPCAAEGDALSTAALLAREGELDRLLRAFPSSRFLQGRLHEAGSAPEILEAPTGGFSRT